MYIDIFAKLFILLGAFLYGAQKLVGIDALNKLTKIKDVQSVFAAIIVASALYFVFNRDFYLPFLGKCVFPSAAITNTNNMSLNENKRVLVTLKELPPKTKVVYWAAKGGNNNYDNPMDAYKEYGNSGLGVTDKKGTITFELDCPSEYSVNKFGKSKILPKHVHYRYELPNYKGLFSRIETKHVVC